MLLAASALFKLLNVLVEVVEVFPLSFQLLFQSFETSVSQSVIVVLARYSDHTHVSFSLSRMK